MAIHLNDIYTIGVDHHQKRVFNDIVLNVKDSLDQILAFDFIAHHENLVVKY